MPASAWSTQSCVPHRQFSWSKPPGLPHRQSCRWSAFLSCFATGPCLWAGCSCAAGFPAGLGPPYPPPHPSQIARAAKWSKPPGLPCRRSRRQSNTISNATGVPTPSGPHDRSLRLNPPPLLFLPSLCPPCPLWFAFSVPSMSCPMWGRLSSLRPAFLPAWPPSTRRSLIPRCSPHRVSNSPANRKAAPPPAVSAGALPYLGPTKRNGRLPLRNRHVWTLLRARKFQILGPRAILESPPQPWLLLEPVQAQTHHPESPSSTAWCLR